MTIPEPTRSEKIAISTIDALMSSLFSVDKELAQSDADLMECSAALTRVEQHALTIENRFDASLEENKKLRGVIQEKNEQISELLEQIGELGLEINTLKTPTKKRGKRK